MEPVTTIVIALAAAALVAAVAWAALRRATAERADPELPARLARAEQRAEGLAKDVADRDIRIERLERDLREVQEDRASLKTDKATLELEKQKDAEHFAARLKELTEAREAMKKDFDLLANAALKQHGETFKTQNREQLESLLNPMREKILEFQQGMLQTRQEAAAGRAALESTIKSLTERSTEMSQETRNLTRALKGQSQVRGAWGEMVLATILEKSGLREGEEFTTQQSETIEGQRLRPDVVVNLPNGHRLIIDSKVSLTAFETWVNAEDDAARAAALKAHTSGMRTHIRGLSSKDYTRLAGTAPDYVIMFVPIEAAFAAATEADHELTLFAIESNVALATPNILITLLRTVASLWQVERQERNAKDIADRAGKLYDKFAGFIEDMKKVDIHLERARGAHLDAMGKLSTGAGNLVRQVEMLRKLGAKTGSKTLPADMVEASGVETELLEGPED
ncbi:MAG: DNA recombination protein RmuC [Pseudomonadota bacterium]|nr:DNA recombination protein RmuC [Pseudomonadota bacterium]